jgi:hypothetical protein
MLYSHLRRTLELKESKENLALDKIYMSKSFAKCIMHSVNHQGYRYGPHEDLYLLVLDTSAARTNKSGTIERCTVSKGSAGLNSFKGKLPIIETITFRKGKNGNWSDDDACVIRTRKDKDMKSVIYEKLDYSTGEWTTSAE